MTLLVCVESSILDIIFKLILTVQFIFEVHQLCSLCGVHTENLFALLRSLEGEDERFSTFDELVLSLQRLIASNQILEFWKNSGTRLTSEASLPSSAQISKLISLVSPAESLIAHLEVMIKQREHENLPLYQSIDDVINSKLLAATIEENTKAPLVEEKTLHSNISKRSTGVFGDVPLIANESFSKTDSEMSQRNIDSVAASQISLPRTALLESQDYHTLITQMSDVTVDHVRDFLLSVALMTDPSTVENWSEGDLQMLCEQAGGGARQVLMQLRMFVASNRRFDSLLDLLQTVAESRFALMDDFYEILEYLQNEDCNLLSTDLQQNLKLSDIEVFHNLFFVKNV